MCSILFKTFLVAAFWQSCVGSPQNEELRRKILTRVGEIIEEFERAAMNVNNELRDLRAENDNMKTLYERDIEDLQSMYHEEVSQVFVIAIAPERRSKCIQEHSPIYLGSVAQNRKNLDECATNRLQALKAKLGEWNRLRERAVSILENHRNSELKACDFRGKSDEKMRRCLQEILDNIDKRDDEMAQLLEYASQRHLKVLFGKLRQCYYNPLNSFDIAERNKYYWDVYNDMWKAVFATKKCFDPRLAVDEDKDKYLYDIVGGR